MADKFNPNDKTDIATLSKAVGSSWKTGKVFRINRLRLMRQSVGRNYSEDGSRHKVPMNLIELSKTIYLQRLVAQNPKVAITTPHQKLKEIVTRFELAGNHLIGEIELGDTLETVVDAALFSKGIIKIALNSSTVEFGGITHDTGQAFADAISLDDWIEDMDVGENEDGQFEGNYWYPTLDEAIAIFPDADKDDFSLEKEQPGTQDKDKNLTNKQNPGNRDEFRPRVKMLDLFLKKQNIVLQCSFSGDNDDPIGKVLNHFKWKGPENGLYRKLSFGKVQGNVMPSAPAQHWFDQHDLANKLYRKLGRQAVRQKIVNTVRAGGSDDGNRVIEADDGDTIKVDDPRNVGEMRKGGIDAPTLAFLLMVKDNFKEFAGNLDNLGGLGPQSETLGQDQLLSASASARIQKMQKDVTSFVTDVLGDLMWYLWYDPNPKQKDVTKSAPGFESISITVPFNPEDREGDYLDYNIKLEPFSMQHNSPETKLQGIMTVIREVVPALRPDMQAQGTTVNTEKLFKAIAKLSNIEELNDIIEYATVDLDGPVGSSDQVRQAPNTTRTNIRKSVPTGGTNQSRSSILQQQLLSGNPQPKQTAQLSRVPA